MATGLGEPTARRPKKLRDCGAYTTPYTATAARRPAIVTLTMNPALDVTASTARVHPSSKVRCYNDRYDPGGGGINAARIAHLLGADVLALFPIGGQTGELLVDLLIREGVPYRRGEIPGRTPGSVPPDGESKSRGAGG